MPYKERPVEKLYWTIGEVADELEVNTSLIRYWEKEFPGLRPKRSGKGDRVYTDKDILVLKRIYHLVKKKGFTIQGAKDALKAKESIRSRADELKEHLHQVKRKLEELRDKL
ncbi:MAG: MerR family transcriptional regulator [Flavobacteriales bacterium]|nr:MerR family transcriptional regulator [Flavobacteriales bacterium]MCB9165879.1 MerR family transcriptional regulator [Flavobacteriales bacterium]